MADTTKTTSPETEGQNRRTFVKRVAYVAPAILTLKAVPSFASHGSSAGPANQESKSPGPPFAPPRGRASAPGQQKSKEKKEKNKGPKK